MAIPQIVELRGCARETGDFGPSGEQRDCPECGHRSDMRKPDASTGNGAGPPGETTNLADKSDMFSLLREEARFSSAMRRQSRTLQESAATENRKERSPPGTATNGGDIRIAVLLVALLTALWLAFEFNSRLSEEFPAAAPYLQQYHDFILGLPDRAVELFDHLSEHFPG